MEPTPSTSRPFRDFASPRKKLKTSHFSESEKLMIINVFKYVKETWPTDKYPAKKEMKDKTADILGISTSAVYRVLKQYTETASAEPAPAASANTQPTIIEKMFTEPNEFASKMDEFLRNNITQVAGEVQQQGRVIIYNVLVFLTELKEDPSKIQVVEFSKPHDLTATVCGVSLRTVDRIRRELRAAAPAATLARVCQPRPVTGPSQNEQILLKQIITSFYSNGEYPTTQEIINAAKEKIDKFSCSHTSMRRILRDFDYRREPVCNEIIVEQKGIDSSGTLTVRNADKPKNRGVGCPSDMVQPEPRPARGAGAGSPDSRALQKDLVEVKLEPGALDDFSADPLLEIKPEPLQWRADADSLQNDLVEVKLEPGALDDFSADPLLEIKPEPLQWRADADSLQNDLNAPRGKLECHSDNSTDNCG